MNKQIAGFYGKVSTHGDFVTRRLPRSFIEPWDRWLRNSMISSKDQLRGRWLDLYLTSPVWHFVLSANVCGPSAWGGVLIPNVDRSNRHFPFVLAAELPIGSNILQVLMHEHRWFTGAAQVALFSLADDFELRILDEKLRAIGTPRAGPVESPDPQPEATEAPVGWSGQQGHDTSEPGPSPDWPAWTGQILHNLLPAYSAWRTPGSPRIEPSLIVSDRLPQPYRFSAFLDGKWNTWGWKEHQHTPLLSCAEHCKKAQHSRAASNRLVWTSASATHPGKVRSVNEDAFLDRQDRRVWAVADGLGGHRAGEVASRQVINALAEVTPARDLDLRISETKDRLQRVNHDLRQGSMRRPDKAISGSTVTALLADDDRCACLWAGDSRAYVFRENTLLPLTRDHSITEELVRTSVISREQASGHPDAHVITRAVGGDEVLLLDVSTLEARPGDLFLLCSDGLTKVVDEETIASLLTQSDLEVMCQKLVHAALERGGDDNITLLLVRASSARPA